VLTAARERAAIEISSWLTSRAFRHRAQTLHECGCRSCIDLPALKASDCPSISILAELCAGIVLSRRAVAAPEMNASVSPASERSDPGLAKKWQLFG
jgi:hypothetical protein